MNIKYGYFIIINFFSFYLQFLIFMINHFINFELIFVELNKCGMSLCQDCPLAVSGSSQHSRAFSSDNHSTCDEYTGVTNLMAISKQEKFRFYTIIISGNNWKISEVANTEFIVCALCALIDMSPGPNSKLTYTDQTELYTNQREPERNTHCHLL